MVTKKMNILVIGDSCEDIFIYGECKRLCPEAPVPVFNPLFENKNGGMATNVLENIKCIAKEENFGVYTEIITNEINNKKIRYIDKTSNQMIIRVDDNDKVNQMNFGDIKIGNGWDVIVISDYNKGFLDIEAIGDIADYAKLSNTLVFLDTKKVLIDQDKDYLKNIDFIKINEKEYKQNYLYFKSGNYDGNLIVTMGDKGAKFNNKIFSINKKSEVRDLSGAGDTFLAGLVIKYIETKNIDDAINFANECASWVVTQKGIVTYKKQ